MKVEVREMVQQGIAEEVMTMIADKPCDGIENCSSIAWGVNPCGSSEEYPVYAPNQVNVDRLEQLVNEYNQLDREIHALNEASGVDCSVILIEPDIECLKDQCAAGPDRYAIIN